MDSHQAASIAILLVSFIKVLLVGTYFMERRGAPDALRGLFAGYCLLVFGLCSGMFLFA